MATMMKEKSREKKKSKPKISKESVHVNKLEEQTVIISEVNIIEASTSQSDGLASSDNILETATSNPENLTRSAVKSSVDLECRLEVKSNNKSKDRDHISDEHSKVGDVQQMQSYMENIKSKESVLNDVQTKSDTLGDTYEEVSKRLERIQIPKVNENMNTAELEEKLTHPQAQAQAYVKTESTIDNADMGEEITENVIPSAPVFEGEEIQMDIQTVKKEVKIKSPCMTIEEAVRLFGEKEMVDVHTMSAREEAIVAAGPMSRPDHPLVDLLLTFSNSWKSFEREKVRFEESQAEERKYRSTLWKVEKKKLNLSEKCACGLNISISATYEEATLLMEKMPIARVKLEALLKDIQESFCHYLHDALLAHYQINEVIAHTVKANKADIREALSLILEALRLNDSGPKIVTDALQRWAEHLVAALVDGGDLQHLLFVLHHLFRQTRSVCWAASVLRMRACQEASALAVLAILLQHTTPDRDVIECTADLDMDELWEEVDTQGSGGTVSEGSLRERDLLALLQTFPLRELLARILLFSHTDVKSCRPYDWGDSRRGRGVVRAACGLRVLLSVLAGAAAAHAQYTRLRKQLAELGLQALRGLEALHAHCSSSYTEELEPIVAAELQACFTAGVPLLAPSQLDKLPTTLLDDETVKEYCLALMCAMHDDQLTRIECLAIDLPALPCSDIVTIVTMAAVNRVQDQQLAGIVMDYLFQTGIKRTTPALKCGCSATARACLSKLMNAHPYMRLNALRTVADMSQVESLDSEAVSVLCLGQWRPSRCEMEALLQDYSCRCPQLLEPLLLQLHYTAHSGVSYDVQLYIARWACTFVSTNSNANVQWPWLLLRALNVHRVLWGHAGNVQDVQVEGGDLFSTAVALLTGSWGHSIPLICEFGVAGLCQLATTRVEDAVHCLQYVVLVLSHSPESVSLTPKFTELITLILKAGPTLMQRALGSNTTTGYDLLLKLVVKQVTTDYPGIPRSGVVSCWLHMLWQPGLPANAQRILDAALLRSQDWGALYRYVHYVMQTDRYREYVSIVVTNVASTPVACEAAVRGAAGAGGAGGSAGTGGQYASLANVVWAQRQNNDKVHVDNALKEIGANYRSDELVIFICASALLSAVPSHPAHLSLWRLFFQLYLHRPVSSQGYGPAIGPLLFSGIINSRILVKLKKQLANSLLHHKNEAELIKNKLKQETVPPEAPKREKSKKIDSELPTSISIGDLTGESVVEIDSEQEKESDKDRVEREHRKRSLEGICSFYEAAADLLKMYLHLLESGEDVSMDPSNSSLERCVPQKLYLLALKDYADRNFPTVPDDVASTGESKSTSDDVMTPFDRAVKAILEIQDDSDKRVKHHNIKSTLEDINFKDHRSLNNLVDKLFKELHVIARQWSSEVEGISSLDSKLLELVRALRVPRCLPAIKQSCANKCKPITLQFSVKEWCLNTGVEREMNENRIAANTLLRQLSRPRYKAAQTAALIINIARSVADVDTAVAMATKAWKLSETAGHCAPVTNTLTGLVSILAERWICHVGELVAMLLCKWRRSSVPVQQALCGVIVCPRAMRPDHWPAVYKALFNCTLSPHALFSYLSKFEMNRWNPSDVGKRKEMLSILLSGAQHWGGNPDESHHMLIELLGMHTKAVVSEIDLISLVPSCSRACSFGSLPSSYYGHVAVAVGEHAHKLTFDQLGNLLRVLGEIWWERRNTSDAHALGGVYAETHAHVLAETQRAFTAAAVQLSYEPVRVGLYVWSSLRESWSPWILPHRELASLFPPLGGEDPHPYKTMLEHFVDTILQVIVDCPGVEASLLQQIFPWALQSYMGEMDLLNELIRLPWQEHSWLDEHCVNTAIQFALTDSRLSVWACNALSAKHAACWLRGAAHDALGGRLAALLYLFLNMPFQHKTLIEAGSLPWHRLPEPALEQALQRFFTDNYNPLVPYHTLPQYTIVMSACCLSMHTHATLTVSAGAALRACGVSHMARAVSTPALLLHAGGHYKQLLDMLDQLVPHLDLEELKDLLNRALVIMCIEPAAAAVLPVWCTWLRVTSRAMLRACACALAGLTQLQYFAKLADALLMHYLDVDDSGWQYISDSWLSCPWREAAPLVRIGTLHAAYGVATGHKHNETQLATVARGLHAVNIDFVEKEIIVALWICYLTRIGVRCTQEAAGEDCKHAIITLLTAWGEVKRSILRVITLQGNNNIPTNKHRILCHLGLSLLTGSEPATRAYQASCTELLGPTPSDVTTWATSPTLNMMPRLAVRLFPSHERYFQVEFDKTREES